MKYPYIVKFNGKWYDAGANVPTSETKEENVVAEKVTTNAKNIKANKVTKSKE